MKEFTRRGLIYGAATVAAYGMLVGVERLCVLALANNDQKEDHPGPAKIVKFDDDGTRVGIVSIPKVRKSDEEWKKQLTPRQYEVTRRESTEFAYSGALYNEHTRGLYRCIGCDNALFDASTKFDSGTGWPSFWASIAKENVYEKSDMSFGVLRREVKCTLCEAHLGHVFTDGPEPTGLRYCMNSVALRFIAKKPS
jgi:peptide-methionine (R)-S-oxide reductase